jgi:hypothetical protein
MTIPTVYITFFQFIAVASRLFGPIAYALQALVPTHARDSLDDIFFISLFFLFGISAFFATRYLGQKQERFTVANITHQLITNSILSALLLLLLCDVCNYQKILLLVFVMSASWQQKLSSALRFENRVQILICIPVTIMWLHCKYDSLETQNSLETQTPLQPQTLLQTRNSIQARNLIQTRNWTGLAAVFSVSILATAQSHDALKKVIETSYSTTLLCVLLHGVFISVFLSQNIYFLKVTDSQTIQNGGVQNSGDLWTDSDTAITSTICVLLAAPVARDTGKWLYETLFTQLFFSLLVLLLHSYVSQNDLMPTLLTLSILQLFANVCLSSKKNVEWD